MKTEGSQKPQNRPNDYVLTYLSAYNGSQFLGWLILSYKIAFFYCTYGTHKGLYKDVAPILNIFQTLAVLEIFNAATGIVKSNPVLTGLQVFSRVFITWHVYYSPPVHDTIAPTLFLVAWGVTEMIRYLFYLLSLLGQPPYFLLWCRYTFFFVLYPLGVTGELLSVWYSLDHIKESKMMSLALPNKINFAFNYYFAVVFIVLSYIPVFPNLYFHMIKQRKKVLGGNKIKTN